MRQKRNNNTEMNTRTLLLSAVAVALLAIFPSCRHDDIVFRPESTQVTDPAVVEPDADGYMLKGFYMLNEGNMGMNKSTLDYFDVATGEYNRNIYGAANPDVPMELGDVGNDLEIYGSRLWAVINCSNKVEVMHVEDARRIGQVEIPNCRSIAFHNGYAYVTSYAGPVQIAPDYKQLGYVAKVDTATLQVVDRCIVGYQPDGIAITGGKIYVANSGGYRVPNYENTVSVIDIATFREEKKIETAINLNHVIADRNGRLWISSRGDYYTDPSQLFCYDPFLGRLVKTFDIPVGSMTLVDGKLYILGNTFSYIDMTKQFATAIVDVETMEVISDSIATDGTFQKMKNPYGIGVNPVTKEVYISDATNMVSPGWLYCFSPEGTMKWRVRTGDIPAHFAFYGVIEK